MRRTALTGADGKFTFANVAPGTYSVAVSRAGFGHHNSVVQVSFRASKKELNIELEINPLSEEVTVTAEAGQVSDAAKLAQPVNVINELEILERGTEVVAQVVDEEQGVNLQRTSPSLSAVFIRGLTGRNVAVYVDGVRYTTSAQRGGVGTFFSLIEPSSLEQSRFCAVQTVRNMVQTHTAEWSISFRILPDLATWRANFMAPPTPFTLHRPTASVAANC